jgi:hypothetical protein
MKARMTDREEAAANSEITVYLKKMVVLKPILHESPSNFPQLPSKCSADDASAASSIFGLITW